MGSGGHDRTVLPCLYKEWMSRQEQELSDLLQHSLDLNNNVQNEADGEETASLLDNIFRNFQDYVVQRRRLARLDICGFFSQRWRTAFENSISWMGGCRPSSYFRLVYALCGVEIDSRLSQFFRDGRSSGFPMLSAIQLSSIDSLQRRTIREEEKLSSELASLQQEIADMPLALIARQSSPDYKLNEEIKEAIGKIAEAMLGTIEKADELRLNTYKQLMEILTPAQGLEYITAVKKLRLCVQAWGMEMDREPARE